MVCPTCGAANEPAAETCFSCGRGLFALIEGAVVSERYEILRPLGRGGMGMVYEAFDRELDEVLALKILQPALARSPDIARRFRSEIKLARKVRHPNVCAIHDYGQDGNHRYIVMEYVRGQDLKRLLHEKRVLPPHEAYELSLQIARGLQAIHQAGVIHRDLKTSNIMLDSRGAVRLMDFGLAKLYEAGRTGPTRTGDIVGTPEYMSPEQARSAPIDARADVYALGIVIYELFTGTVPFRGETPLVTMMMHLNDDPFGAPEASRLPAAIRSMLEQMLAKDRAQRLGSCREVLEALRLARSHIIGPATPATAEPGHTVVASADVTDSGLLIAAPQPSGAMMGRRRRWLGAAALAVAAAGSAGWLWPRKAPSIPSPSAFAPPMADATVVPPASPSPPGIIPAINPAPPSSPAARATATPRPRATVVAESSAPLPMPSPSGVPVTAPSAPPAVESEPGLLRVVVSPYADVSVDGKPVGTSPPLPPLRLPSGAHTIYLTHPSYRPLVRDVVIRPGESTRLEVDLAQEAVRK